jgi:hypothetical protein
MDKLLTWFLNLGNARAVANASVLGEQHRREEWLLRSLSHRVEHAAQEAAAPAA